jgi:hypothetical protein
MKKNSLKVHIKDQNGYEKKFKCVGASEMKDERT